LERKRQENNRLPDKEDSMEKRLYRSKNNRMLAGVCGGLARYFDIDPVLVRVLAVVFLVAFNIMTVLAYLLLTIIVPIEDTTNSITK
jgi:phage shock protein C